jgi:hypothetical protein
VTQEALFDVLWLQGLAEQRILAQIDHAGSQIIAGPPVSVDLAELVAGKTRTRVGIFGRGRLYITKYTCHEFSFIPDQF